MESITDRFKDIANFTVILLGHTVGALVAVAGIWAFAMFFHFLWGTEDPRLFDVVPLRWFFDAADGAVMIRFILKILFENWK